MSNNKFIHDAFQDLLSTNQSLSIETAIPSVTELTTDSVLNSLGISPTNITSELSASLANIVPIQIQGAINFVADISPETLKSNAVTTDSFYV